MRLIIRFFVVLATVSISPVVFAGSDFPAAAREEIKVKSVSPEIQEQLNKATPEERKSLEAAMHTGSLFVQQHFDGNAYDTSSENQDWFNEVAPLITLNIDSWAEQYGDFSDESIKIGTTDFLATRLTCPEVSLISVQQDDHVIDLIYRTKSVGVLIDTHGYYTYGFNSESAGQIYELRLALDEDSALVNEVIPIDKWRTWSYNTAIAYIQSMIKSAPYVLTRKQAENPNKKQVAAEVSEYKKSTRRNHIVTIEEIKKSAAKYCK